MSSEFEFSSMLISNVSEKKCLYCKDDFCYFKKPEKEKAWNDVAAKTGRSVSECKNKWKLLRERFTRELKKQVSPTGCADSSVGEWPLFNQMSFLKDSVTPRPSRCKEVVKEEASISETSWEADNDMCPSTPPKKIKESTDVYETLNQAASMLLEDISKATSLDTTEMYLKTIQSLMQDLPTQVRDQFMAETFNNLMQLRSTYLNY